MCSIVSPYAILEQIPNNMNEEFLNELYRKYSKTAVDEAIAYLSYKNPTPLPKCEENSEAPILYVFRHGQTVDNAEFVFSGWRDSDLTELGKKQALELAPKLKDKKIGLLFTSDQIRSIKTMELAISQNEGAKQIEAVRDPRIKERCYGDFQGKSKLEMHLENAELLKQERRSYTFIPPNGESIEMVTKRVYDFIRDLREVMLAKNLNAAVSCHGNSIRGFRKYFEHLSNEETATIETPLGQDYASYLVS